MNTVCPYQTNSFNLKMNSVSQDLCIFFYLIKTGTQIQQQNWVNGRHVLLGSYICTVIGLCNNILIHTKRLNDIGFLLIQYNNNLLKVINRLLCRY